MLIPPYLRFHNIKESHHLKVKIVDYTYTIYLILILRLLFIMLSVVYTALLLFALDMRLNLPVNSLLKASEDFYSPPTKIMNSDCLMQQLIKKCSTLALAYSVSVVQTTTAVCGNICPLLMDSLLFMMVPKLIPLNRKEIFTLLEITESLSK